MSDDPTVSMNIDRDLETRRIRRMLKQLYSIAENASLTGAFGGNEGGGAAEAADQYNAILDYMQELSLVSSILFRPLAAEATWERVAVSSKMLEAYLSEQPDSDRLFLGGMEDMEKLKDVGRIIRDNLPDFLKRRVQVHVTAPGTPPPTPPTPPTPPSGATPPIPPVPPVPPPPGVGGGYSYTTVATASEAEEI